MPRKNLIRSSDCPYHVYNRSLERAFYPINQELLWKECNNLLRILSWAFGFKVHAFVLMANHYHLLVSTPDLNLDVGMRYFQSELSRWLSEQTGRDLFRFGTRYRWSLLRGHGHVVRVYKYIIQNPLRAGIVENAFDYRFSSIANQLGNGRLEVPLHLLPGFGDLPPLEGTDFERWANNLPEFEELEATRRGLHRAEFSIGRRIRMTAKTKGGGQSR